MPAPPASCHVPHRRCISGSIREFFTLSTVVKAVFIQIDDFYHLKRIDQPFVMDYVHRLCKDLPLYFKVATLRHASVLYADRAGQPTGAQERHDYQPINIDFTFAVFRKTENNYGESFTNLVSKQTYPLIILMGFLKAMAALAKMMLG